MSAPLRHVLAVRTAGAAASASGHPPKRALHVLAVTPACPVNKPLHNHGRSQSPGARSDEAICPWAPAGTGRRPSDARRWKSSTPRPYGDSVQAMRRVAESTPSPTRVDAVVIGAGQAGLSVAYHLQKAGDLRFVTLDANQEPGGAWRHRWHSLQLFSTRRWSSLPGYPMSASGGCEDGYPTTREMAMYMEEYEEAMKLNVVRPVKVTGVTRTTMGTFLVETDCLIGGTSARWECRAVISAAGTHGAPVWPRLPGSEIFRGVQIHSSQYRNAEDFRGARVVVVGSGNSGAQILAEVSQPGIAASTLWSTEGSPSFLPKGLSGKDIFDTVARLRQKQGFVEAKDIPSLHSIIMQPGVLEAMERGVYDQHIPALARFTPTGVSWDADTRTVGSCGEDGEEREAFLPGGHAEVDAVIWCTGYNANTSHLARLDVVQDNSTLSMGEADMGETNVPGVFAVGYGNWSGVGSGSIPGATMYARRAALGAVQHLRGESSCTTSSNLAASMRTWPSPAAAGASPWPTAGRVRSPSEGDVSGVWPGGGASNRGRGRTSVGITGIDVSPIPGPLSRTGGAQRQGDTESQGEEVLPVAA